MKTKLLFTITGILLLAFFQVFSANPEENTGMQTETQTADGSVLMVNLQSEGIANNMLGDDGERTISIYLPPGYDANGSTNYPVVYMLPGDIGTKQDWFSVMGGPAFTEKLNKAIKTEKIKPMILVFPDGKNKITRSWYTNSTVTGNWEDYIVTDLVNYMDENFRTLPFAAARGIAGRDIGGYGALKLATKHPDVFSAVYSINGFVDFETVITDKYMWAKSFEIANEAQSYPTDDAFANQLLGMAVSFCPDENNPMGLGKLPRNSEGEIDSEIYQKWLSQDPMYLASEYADNLKKLKAIAVDCNTSNFLVMLNNNYSGALKKNNVEHMFQTFQGNDNSALVSRVCDFLLPMFSENLSQSLLKIEAKCSYTYSDILEASMIADGNIFVVPDGMETNGTLVKSADNTIQIETPANETNEIPLKDFNKGIYNIYAASNSGFIGEPVKFGINGGDPQVKICVTDSYTGKAIEACGLNINGECVSTNEKGEFSCCKEGKISICFTKENYGEMTKSVTIYTDTVINFSLVKDSRIQVIEKGFGIPVFEAMVTQDGRATLTGKDGYTTVQNLVDGVLDCRIFKQGYFTEVVHAPLNPGSTKRIEITKKQATVDFYVMSVKGPVWDIPVVLGNVTVFTDETGKASFENMDTRVEYNYSIKTIQYETHTGTIYLEADYIEPILLADKTVDETALTEKSRQLTTAVNGFENSEVLVYPNPAKEAVNVKTDGKTGYTVELLSQSGSVLYKSKIEGTLHRINLSNLSNGVYFVTVKSDNYNHTQRIMKL